MWIAPFSNAREPLYCASDMWMIRRLVLTGFPIHTMAADDNDDGKSDGETGVLTKTKPKTEKPPLYKVMLLNDDYTPMEFVIHVLERFFNKNHDDATRIMLHVHQKGVGVCGVFTLEVAETKATQVMDLAKQHQHPLQCVVEKDDDDDSGD